MSNSSIARIIQNLEGLLTGLDQAYWEANSLDRKDFFYDLISAIRSELSELNKLSVQDHDLDYEPITEEFQAARTRLGRLHELLDQYVLKSATAVHLEGLISETIGSLTRK